MIKLLEQAITENLLRPLDLRFAQMLVADENPILLFIFAYLSAQTGAGHVCLPLNIIQQDKLFDGRHTELSQAIWQEMAQPSASVLIKAIVTYLHLLFLITDYFIYKECGVMKSKSRNFFAKSNG